MRPKKTVLYVGANEARLSCQTFLLETRGYRAVAAESGAEAVKILGEMRLGTVDVLVTELELPDISGDELARRAKLMHPGLPVLLLSYQLCGYDHELFADAFLPRGCHEPAVLLERIRAMAARKRGPKKAMRVEGVAA